MSIVLEDTGGCAKKSVCALNIYLITLLSSSYVIIMFRAINAPRHGKKVVDGLNADDKGYLNEQMELSNDTSIIGSLPSDSKYFSIKLSKQCLHMINNKDRVNGINGSTKMKKRESLFKYQ